MPSPARTDARRLGAVALLAAAALSGCGGDERPAAGREGRTIVIDVPRGTAARLDRGERVRVVPLRLETRVGDRLVLANRDTRAHTIGPFLVSPGQRMTTRLSRPGRYTGDCTVHAGSRPMTIVVRPR